MTDRARIMFADGSKQMAHNTDDLFERWMARRSQMPVAEQKADPERHIEIFLPNLHLPESIEAIRSLQVMIGEKQKLVESHASQLRVDIYAGRTAKTNASWARGLAYKAASTRAMQQLAALKTKALELRASSSDSFEEDILWAAVRELRQRVSDLEKRLAEQGKE